MYPSSANSIYRNASPRDGRAARYFRTQSNSENQDQMFWEISAKALRKIKAETGEASAFLVRENSVPPRDQSFTFDGIT